eukprot:COSAG01_NODE_4605_length_4884_cov_10.307210_5_plen_85_part_00
MVSRTWASWLVSCMCVLLVVACGMATAASKGCPCKEKQACNDCCAVEHNGKHYGPHCRLGVCGQGGFPQSGDTTWTPEKSGKGE